MTRRTNVYFVCGGRYHDFDFPRLEILRLLNEHERIRVRIAESYDDIDAITASDALITYTVDVVPDETGQQRLSQWLEEGRRWFALHGTNSIIDYDPAAGIARCPQRAPIFMTMLGSQFVAHPDIGPYDVEVTDPEHPLVRNLPSSFRVVDELYLSEFHPGNRVLLHTKFNGIAQQGFEKSDWRNDEIRPVMYVRQHGSGELVYLNLGHRRGRYDMQPVIDEYPDIEPGAWVQPTFYELLRRGIRWMARIDEPGGTAHRGKGA